MNAHSENTGLLYLGEKAATLESSGRLTLPACFRKAVESRSADLQVVLFHDPNNKKITVYDLATFRTAIAAVDGENVKATLGPAGQSASLDHSGRLVLSPRGLQTLFGDVADKDQVTVVGCIDYCEIWSTAVWQQIEADRDQEIGAALDVLAATIRPSGRGQSQTGPESAVA